MIEGMYAAISGLQSNQEMLDVVANNLSNLNTVGYKDQTVQFADALSETLRGGGASTTANGGTNPVQVGAGVQVAGVETDESTGTLESTGNPLDVAIEGNGYLCVANGDPATSSVGTLDYTRAGDLTTNSAGYLTTQSGQYVMGYAQNSAGTGPNTGTGSTPAAPSTFIQIPTTATNVAIGTNGQVTYTDENPADTSTYGDTVAAGYIGLADFANAQGLQSIGNNDFITSGNSGTPSYGGPATGALGQTISGELEGSNVDLATEFTNMITAQRGYQANAQVITTANDMLQTLEQITTA